MHLSNFLVLTVLFAMPPSVEACSRISRPTDRQLFDEAKEVFVAQVVSTKIARLSPQLCEDEGGEEDGCSFVEARYQLTAALKGNPKRSGKVGDLVFGPGNCSLGLLTGWYYVFYVGEESNFVPHISGSFPLGSVLDEAAVELYKHIKEPPHERPRDDA